MEQHAAKKEINITMTLSKLELLFKIFLRPKFKAFQILQLKSKYLFYTILFIPDKVQGLYFEKV